MPSSPFCLAIALLSPSRQSFSQTLLKSRQITTFSYKLLNRTMDILLLFSNFTQTPCFLHSCHSLLCTLKILLFQAMDKPLPLPPWWAKHYSNSKPTIIPPLRWPLSWFGLCCLWERIIHWLYYLPCSCISKQAFFRHITSAKIFHTKYLGYIFNSILLHPGPIIKGIYRKNECSVIAWKKCFLPYSKAAHLTN